MEFFAISNGIPVHISDTKNGEETILLLHGYFETLYIYSEFSALLNKKYRVISIDLPGHGLSGSLKEVNSMEFCAAVARDVLNICKVDCAYIAGHSMGGYVAQSCMELFPDVFKGLILFNSTPFADDPEKKADRLREIELIESGKLNILASMSIPKMYAPENLRRLDDKIQETIEITETHDPAGITACVRGLMERTDHSQFLSELDKSLLFFGDKDKFISAEKAQDIIRKCPKATVVMLPNIGHNSFIEEPVKTAEAVAHFIAG